MSCPLNAPGALDDDPQQDASQRDMPVDATIDITAEQCPMTFIKVKMKLETLTPGGRLKVRLNGGEPLDTIPHTLKGQGHAVTVPQRESDTPGHESRETYTLIAIRDGAG